MFKRTTRILDRKAGGVFIVAIGVATVALPLLALVAGLDQLGYIDARHLAGRPIYWRA